MSKKKLHPNQIGTRLPLNFTLCVLLLLREFNAVDWVQGVVWTLVALIWIGSFVAIYKEEWVKPYHKDE